MSDTPDEHSRTRDESTAMAWWAEIDGSWYEPRRWCHGNEVLFRDGLRGRNAGHGYDWLRLTFCTADGREFHKLARSPMHDQTSDETEAIQWWNALKQEPYDLGGLQFLAAARGYDDANDRRWVRLSLINGQGREFTKICRNPPLAPGEEWAP